MQANYLTQLKIAYIILLRAETAQGIKNPNRKKWVRFGCDFSPKMSKFCPYPKQKRLFKKKSLGIIFIKFTVVRRQGIEPRTLGLRGPWCAQEKKWMRKKFDLSITSNNLFISDKWIYRT